MPGARSAARRLTQVRTPEYLVDSDVTRWDEFYTPHHQKFNPIFSVAPAFAAATVARVIKSTDAQSQIGPTAVR